MSANALCSILLMKALIFSTTPTCLSISYSNNTTIFECRLPKISSVLYMPGKNAQPIADKLCTMLVNATDLLLFEQFRGYTSMLEL